MRWSTMGRSWKLVRSSKKGNSLTLGVLQKELCGLQSRLDSFLSVWMRVCQTQKTE